MKSKSKSILILTLGVYLLFSCCNTDKNKMDISYDSSRIINVFNKARQGDKIVLGYIGGSITQGYAASTEEKKWVNLVTQWWKDTFPKADISMINAGIGGTGSNIATFRVKDDLLKYNPDFVIIEFAVNDSLNSKTTEYMEGLVRQILSQPNHPGVMILTLKDVNGTTAQEYQIPVAEHYKIPVVSFADLIDSQVSKDSIALKDIFIDGLHPVDIGMKYIAGFIIDELNKLYSNLPENNVQIPDTILPAPLLTDSYEYPKSYNFGEIEPVTNSGWVQDGTGWSADKPGDEITFSLKNCNIAILYSMHNDKKRGAAEIWLDNNIPFRLESYWDQTWGPATLFKQVGDNLEKTEHTLHIKIIEEQPKGSEGHYFHVMKILAAGN